MVTACTVGLAIPVPGEAVTCTGCSVSVYTTCNAQVQCHRILAGAIAYNIVVVASGCIHLSVPIPGERTAGRSRSIRMLTIVDGQVQCHRILTTLCIGEDIVMI